MNELYETYNGLKVGDSVEYETVIETETGVNHIVPGVVVKLLSATRVLIRNHKSNTTFEAQAEWCYKI